jgi:co-chaperonin GroES (HSP10)
MRTKLPCGCTIDDAILSTVHEADGKHYPIGASPATFCKRCDMHKPCACDRTSAMPPVVRVRGKSREMDAVQFTNDGPDPIGVERTWDGKAYVITAHSQRVYLQPGDWIIGEPNGVGHYPIKAAIFNVTHERVTAQAKTQIQPLQDRVLVKVAEPLTQSPDGIVLPQPANEGPNTLRRAVVAATGPRRMDEDGHTIPVQCAIGDTVLIPSRALYLEVPGESGYFIVYERVIAAIVETSAEPDCADGTCPRRATPSGGADGVVI